MRTTAIASLLVITALVAFSSGCGVDDQHTQLMWRSIQSSLGKTQGHGQALTASFDFSIECEESGDADLTARVDVTSPLEHAVNVLFGYDVTYNECRPDENTLDGELHYAAVVDAGASDAGAAVNIDYTYEGSVTSTGDSNGTCDIDVTGHLDASASHADATAAGPGDEFASDAHVVYDGTICGHDAHEVLNADADVDVTRP
jgi:hypothetical protein